MVGRRRSCKNEINKGTWSKEEDDILFNYVTRHGEGKWREVAQRSGLKRCAKSCRYRYLNYLKPGIKRGDISGDEEDLIIRLHSQLGKRWALIAKRLPGRTDIEIKNYWKIYLSKKLRHERRLEEKKSSKMLMLEDNVTAGSSDYSTSMNLSSSNIQTEDDEDDDYEYEYDDDDNVCDEKVGRHGLKGAWSKNEDEILSNYIALHGEGKWNKVAQKTGLKRCGKSCRHRYLHYLKPGIKRGNISKEEEDMIIRLHQLHGNRWTLIAKKLPGRTDSEIKNYWHAYLSKKFLEQPQSWPSLPSPSPSQYLQKPENKYTEQINGVYAPQAAFPISTSITNDNFQSNMMVSSEYDQSTNAVSPNSFELQYDDAFLDDFLFNIFQNDQIGDGMNSKMPEIEDHSMVASSSFTDQCQLPEDVMDFWTSSEFPFFDC